MIVSLRKAGRTAAIFVCMALPLATPLRAAADESTWSDLKTQLFKDRPIQEDSTLLTLDAPTRAEDAALVPIDFHVAVPEADTRKVVSVTVVVDENPAPMVSTVRFDVDGTRHFDFSTRVRVNSYSFVRAVAEASDGTLHMVKSYVKAAGGCSAPAVKDPEEAKAEAGKMRFRVFGNTGRDEAQVQIRHPNYSGMQMDQVTRLYTPAWFVEQVTVKQGDQPVFAMHNGISLSEDPTFRFSYKSNGLPVSVEAKDSQGNSFREQFPAAGSS
jgi:sulfur-oxidizing protein SoxY